MFSFQGTLQCFKNTFEKLNLKFLKTVLGGDEESRTPDPLLARQVLSQLSYTPTFLKGFPILVGLSGLEPPTSRLSGVRSNHLSYKPSGFLLNYQNLQK